MKKTLLLTLAAGLVGATPLLASDLYITGSTAFRANVHDACTKLFSPPLRNIPARPQRAATPKPATPPRNGR